MDGDKITTTTYWVLSPSFKSLSLSQVDPSFAYAHTLLGHEYVMIEELEKALTCFRTAVRMDPRHYNAWYGIGLTYYKQERFQLTEIYYRKALGLNPYNPILMCHVAVVGNGKNGCFL